MATDTSGSSHHSSALYELVDGWARPPQGWSLAAVGIAVDKNDNVFILNRPARANPDVADHPVTVFDRQGNFLRSWGAGYFAWPHEIAVGPDGAIWVVDEARVEGPLGHTVTKYDADGRELLVLGTKGRPSDNGYVNYMGESENNFFESLATIKRGGPPFNRPCGVDVSQSGEIFVSDGYGNARVHKFSPEGSLLLSWGEPGTGVGEFRCVHGVCVDDARDRILVCDRENNRIQIFDPNGRYLGAWPIYRPSKAVIDSEGLVYVCHLADRPEKTGATASIAGVSIFDPEGRLITRWGTSDDGLRDLDNALFLAPHSIAIDSARDVYVGEVRESKRRGTKVVRKFARQS